MAKLHRNNAAEWMMAIVVWPIAWMLRLLRGNSKRAAPLPKSRSAMIEGLPPRTMN